jgi:hypothetical protein
MSDRPVFDKPLIEPIYLQNKPNQLIDLGQVAVRFSLNGTKYQEMATVKMRFEPDTCLQFIFPLQDKDASFINNFNINSTGIVKFTLNERNITFDALRVPPDEEIIFLPKKTVTMMTEPSNTISTANFHLFNFPNFSGPEDYRLRTSKSQEQLCGRVMLNVDGWKITISATDRIYDLEKALKAQGGYALMHIGQIMRDDGANFTNDQLDELLNCLHYFLSFVLGRWIGIALPIGFDNTGKRVFEKWGMPTTTRGHWNGMGSWFDEQHGEFLTQVFPGFLRLWKKTLWKQTLIRVLYRYMQAGDRGDDWIDCDTGLILAQTALESLAWTHCVQDCKMVSPDAFKPSKLVASDQLRLLITSLGIPKEIPSSLSALRNYKKWSDSCHAITDIRNSLIHSDKKSESYTNNNIYKEVYNLSLWYIEIVLLRLCGHIGNYANRLDENRWAGTVESVPWTQNDANKDD